MYICIRIYIYIFQLVRDFFHQQDELRHLLWELSLLACPPYINITWRFIHYVFSPFLRWSPETNPQQKGFVNLANPEETIPMASMYVYLPTFQSFPLKRPNVSKYTIHGWYGIWIFWFPSFKNTHYSNDLSLDFNSNGSGKSRVMRVMGQIIFIPMVCLVVFEVLVATSSSGQIAK